MVPLNELRLVAYGAVALATGTLGLLILAGNPRRNWNQWLAFFLLLVAGNFAAQTMVAVARGQMLAGALTPEGFAHAERLFGRLGWLVLTFDPAALAYFASIFPRRGGLLAHRWGLPALAITAGSFMAFEALTGALSRPQDGYRLVGLLFFAYLGLCYAYAAHRLLRNFLGETSAVMARQLGLVALGVLVVTVPRLGLLFDDVHRYFGGFTASDALRAVASLSVRVGVLVAGYLLLARWLARLDLDPPRRDEARRLLHLAGLAFVGFGLLFVLSRGIEAAWRAGVPVGPALLDARDVAEVLVFAVRWMVFAAALVVGIVRLQVLAVHPATATVAGAAVGAGVGSVLAVAAASAWGPVMVVLATLASFGLGLGVARLLDRQRRRAAPDYLHERRLEVYQAHLAAAFAASASPGAPAEELEALQTRLGISRREHETLLAVAQAEEAGTRARGEMLGRYQVLRRLGAGGHATVYLARDRQDGGLVVLKRLRAEALGSQGALDAALREVEVARRCSHPNLLAVHDMVRLPDGAVVVLEYAEGGSLRDLLDRVGGPLPGPEVRSLLRQCLAGLEALHEAGLVHGDLKPENVLLAADGTVKLADFGTCRLAAGGATMVHGDAGLGTLRYMAPELVRGAGPSRAADLYAIGAIAHEALTGRPYIDAPLDSPAAAIARILDARPSRAAAIPDPTWRAARRALAPDPSRRPASAAAMAAALDEAAVETPDVGRQTRASKGLPRLGPGWPGG